MVIPLQDSMVGDVRSAILLLVASVGVVLLIALVNVAHPLLTRAAGRQREMAIRPSLGATRNAIVRQLLAESGLLGTVGAAIRFLFAAIAVRGLVVIAPSQVPRLADVSVDVRVLIFTFIMSLLRAFVFGSAPALVSSRTHWNPSMKERGRTRNGGVGRSIA